MPYTDKKIIIIGSGPAALSLSATLKLASIPHTILEKKSKSGGILSDIHNEMEDFIVGTYDDGHDFVKKVDGFVKKYKLDIKYNSEVSNIDIENKTITYKNKDTYHTINYDIVVIATGSRFKKELKFENLKFNHDIYYRISHDLNDFKGKRIAVIGGGDNATVAALRLVKFVSKVYLINKNDSWNSRKDLVDKISKTPKIEILNNTELKSLSGDDNLNSIEIFNKNTKVKRTLDIDKIVFKIGYLPNSEFLKSGIELDEKGYIITLNKYQTSVKGVYAIGDIVSSAYKRIAIAMGHGVDLGNYFIWEVL